MSDFFDYQPRIIGFIFDFDHMVHLLGVKESVIGLIRSLEADTEDKVYIYDPDNIQFDTFLGESVGRVANWKRGSWLDPKHAPNAGVFETYRLIARTSPDERRHILVVTDNAEPMSAVKRCCQHIAKNRDQNFRFSVLEIGSAPDYSAVTSHPFASRHHFSTALELTKDKLQEIING